MFIYSKKLQYPVKIKNPNPKLAKIILTQYGGPDGELGASLRYLSQRYSMPFDELKGLLTDIATEELGHLEMVGSIVHQLTRNLKDEQMKEIQDGMRVGIDYDSVDQRVLTHQVCAGKNVEYVNVDYSRILERVVNGDIDAAIWNKDEITEKFVKVNYSELNGYDTSSNEAVMVVSKEESEMVELLKNIIDPETVVNIQKLVLEGKITPSY